MLKSDSIAKLAPALVKAQSVIKAAHKSGENKFDRYKYTKLEDFLDQAKHVLADNGLALVIGNPIVAALPDRTTKNGGAEHACQVQVSATLIHESGEWIEVVGHGEGQDRADKSIYKAITGAKKYAVAGLLAIPTTDDPEADESVGQSRPKVNSAGETVKKKPKWEDAQKLQAGELKAALMAYGDGGAEAFDTLWRDHQYDEPDSVIALLTTELNAWKG
jgi:hypothetical protein